MACRDILSGLDKYTHSPGRLGSEFEGEGAYWTERTTTTGPIHRDYRSLTADSFRAMGHLPREKVGAYEIFAGRARW